MKPLIFLDYSVFEKKFIICEMGDVYTEKQNMEIQRKFKKTKQKINLIENVNFDTILQILKQIENDENVLLHIGIVSYGMRRAVKGQKFLTDEEEKIWPIIQKINNKLGA